MRHVLVVTESGERDYDVEHPEGCPVVHHASGIENVPDVEEWRCDVGAALDFSGFESLDGRESIAPGRYIIELVCEHTPSTPNGPAETDTWLAITAALTPTCQVDGCDAFSAEALAGEVTIADFVGKVTMSVCAAHFSRIAENAVTVAGPLPRRSA